eukprot:613490-Pyramimonas_sp.AAC.1
MPWGALCVAGASSPTVYLGRRYYRLSQVTVTAYTHSKCLKAACILCPNLPLCDTDGMWKPSRSAEKASKLAVPINPGFRCEHLQWAAAGGANPRDITIWVEKGEGKHANKGVWSACLSEDYEMVMANKYDPLAKVVVSINGEDIGPQLDGWLIT